MSSGQRFLGTRDWLIGSGVALMPATIATGSEMGNPRHDSCAKIANMQLHGAMLFVKDLEEMKRFYGQVLGVEPANQKSTNEWAVFDTGGIRFALHAIPGDIAQNIEIASPPEPRESGAVKLIFAVKDVEGARERLESLGIQTVRRPWQQPGEACDAVDPEGNIFQLSSSGAEALPA